MRFFFKKKSAHHHFLKSKIKRPKTDHLSEPRRSDIRGAKRRGRATISAKDKCCSSAEAGLHGVLSEASRDLEYRPTSTPRAKRARPHPSQQRDEEHASSERIEDRSVDNPSAAGEAKSLVFFALA